MPLSCMMWFSRQWKKPSKQLTTVTQPQPAFLWLNHLYYRSSHFWLLKWLTHKPATCMVHRLKSSWTNTWWSSTPVVWRNQWQAVLDGSSGCGPQSCTPGVGLVVGTSIRSIHVECIFSLYGMLTAGRRNWLKKNSEMRVFLKLNLKLNVDSAVTVNFINLVYQEHKTE